MDCGLVGLREICEPFSGALEEALDSVHLGISVDFSAVRVLLYGVLMIDGALEAPQGACSSGLWGLTCLWLMLGSLLQACIMRV